MIHLKSFTMHNWDTQFMANLRNSTILILTQRMLSHPKPELVGDCVMGQDILEENEDEKGGPTANPRTTRSGKVFNITTKPQNPWQALLKCLIPLVLFVGQRTMMFTMAPIKLSSEKLYVSMEDIILEPLIQPRQEMDPAHLDYVNACNEWLEGKDIRWTPVAMHNHHHSVSPCFDRAKKKVIREKHLRLEVEMADGERQWVAAETIRLEAPRVIAQYVIDRKMFNHPDFKWVKEHFRWDNKKVRKLRTFSAISHKDQKFKFGVQVPRSPKHALELDKMNGDTGWDDSIQTELGQINAYQTFCVLE
jgi:hypothetical protein